jgi:SH3 domain-containing protein
VTKSKVSLFLAALVVIALVAGSAPRATAATDVTFTVSVKSAFLRSGPGLGYPRVYSVTQGQVYAVLGRNADASWLRLDFAGATSEAWVMAAFGKVDGDVNALPQLAATGADAPAPPSVSSAPSSSAPAVSSDVSYTVLVKSAFARAAPSFSAPRVYSVFKGQTYRVLSRSTDGVWVQIDFPNAVTEAWVVAAYGSLSGDLGAVPIYGGAPTQAAPAPGAAASPSSNPSAPGSIIVVGSRARDIYQYGLTLGNNPRRFSKVGDCNSVNPYFLASFDNPSDYRLGGPYASLQETVWNFYGSFSRDSLATHTGFAAATVLDPTWANGKVCKPGENALECEYRLNHPSIAIISLGTNSVWQTDADYEASLRRVVEFFIDHGVVPILSTKADDLEGGGRFNAIVARLAKEYDVPLWNFRGAVENLPNHGLTSDGFHLVWDRSFFTSADSAQTGWQVRNLTALQALDAVWRAVR